MGLDVVTHRQVKVVKVEGYLVTLSLNSTRYAASPAFELEGLRSEHRRQCRNFELRTKAR